MGEKKPSPYGAAKSHRRHGTLDGCQRNDRSTDESVDVGGLVVGIELLVTFRACSGAADCYANGKCPDNR